VHFGAVVHFTQQHTEPIHFTIAGPQFAAEHEASKKEELPFPSHKMSRKGIARISADAGRFSWSSFSNCERS
jgi:hypothetical protein